MTNKEKFKEIFGIEPDCGHCNPYPCEENDCKYWEQCENQPGCPCDNWWDWEFEEPTTKNDLGVDAISRADVDAVIEQMRVKLKNGRMYILAEVVQDIIRELPPVTPQEPRKGHWILKPHIYGVAFCSECGFELKINNTNYCSNCGADMRSKVESENKE